MRSLNTVDLIITEHIMVRIMATFSLYFPDVAFNRFDSLHSHVSLPSYEFNKNNSFLAAFMVFINTELVQTNVLDLNRLVFLKTCKKHNINITYLLP